MPKKIIKNCVYDFALALCSELEGLGFCTVAPFKGPNIQNLLDLTDSEMLGLDRSIKRWQHDTDSIGLTFRCFGDIVVILDTNVRTPKGGRYFYSVCMTLVHQPTARLLSEFRRLPFDPFYTTQMEGPVTQYFKSVKDNLPEYSSQYLSKTTWEEHGPKIVDYYVTGIKNDLLPLITQDSQLEDRLLVLIRNFKEHGADKIFNPNRLSKPAFSTSHVILCALNDCPEFGERAIASILETQERVERAIPDAAERTKAGLDSENGMEYIDAYFIEQFQKLVASQAKTGL